jgi:hypothetical protein
MHRIDKSKDPNFWSVRVSQDVRIVVHRMASSLLLAYVDHHDKAYAWAERRRIEAHPRTGAIQIVEARELMEEDALAASASRPGATAPRQPRLFEDLTDDDLLSIGVPADWVGDVSNATEEAFDQLEQFLPSEAYDALLSYAIEGVFQAPSRAPSSALSATAKQPHVRVVDSASALQFALDDRPTPWNSRRRANFRQFLMNDFRGVRTGNPLTRRAAESYCSYVARAESALNIALDSQDLSQPGLATIIDRLRLAQTRALIPDTTLLSCISGLRAYAQFRGTRGPSQGGEPATLGPARQIRRPKLGHSAGFRAFLLSDYGKAAGGPLAAASAGSYCSYINQIETFLAIDLDDEDLSDAGIESLVHRVRARQRAANLGDKTISDWTSGLRAYARYRDRKTAP